jgi:hypothetical protein
MQYLSNYLLYTKKCKNKKLNVYTCIQNMHTKHRRREKNIEQTENLPTPHQKSNGPSLTPLTLTSTTGKIPSAHAPSVITFLPPEGFLSLVSS